MKRRGIASTAVALLAAAAVAGCSSPETEEKRVERGSSAVETCKGHGGVAAFDDEAVICQDQTFEEERGSNAVKACRGRGGVRAFDDDIVICRDQTFHEAEGG
jgi:hypothetical protein